MSALDLGGIDTVFDSLASDGRFAGVADGGAGPVRFWKKPAMPCCFGPGFGVLEVPVFFFCTPISLPSIPRAILSTVSTEL